MHRDNLGVKPLTQWTDERLPSGPAYLELSANGRLSLPRQGAEFLLKSLLICAELGVRVLEGDPEVPWYVR